MRMPSSLRRHGRFCAVGLALWLLAQIVSGPQGAGEAILFMLSGLALIGAALFATAGERHLVLAGLVLLVPVRVFEPEVEAVLRAFLPATIPALPQLLGLGVSLLAAFLLSRPARRIVRLADRVRLPVTCFMEASVTVPLAPDAVWPELALAPGRPHWNPRIRRVLADPGEPHGLVTIPSSTAPDRRPVFLRELDREEGVFQEYAVRPGARFAGGMPAIVSFLIEGEDVGGSRVTFTMEVQGPGLLTWVTLWLDNPLPAYAAAFRLAMAEREVPAADEEPAAPALAA